MVPKHHNKAFILLLSNLGQSQLHFGTKFILVKFRQQKQKIDIFTKKHLNRPKKGNLFVFKGPRRVLMASFCSHHG